MATSQVEKYSYVGKACICLDAYIFFFLYQYKKLQYNATFYYTLITIQYYKELYHGEQKTMSTPWQHIKTYTSTKYTPTERYTHYTILTDSGVCSTPGTRPATEAPDAEH